MNSTTRVAVLWDLDGTLVDSEPLHELAHINAATALRLSIPENFHAGLIGLSGAEVHAQLSRTAGLKMTAGEWQRFKFEHYQRLISQLEPKPGITELVETLHDRQVPMAVVSNSTREEVRLNLQATGFDRYFDVVISRNDVQHGKPDPVGYRLAANRLQMADSACIVVEDSLPGTEAGLAAQMQTVYVPEVPALLDACPAGAIPVAPGEALRDTLLSLLTKDG